MKFDRRKIWWLASYPKSGNTWVRVFLSHLMFERSDINNLMGVVSDLTLPMYQSTSAKPLESMTIEDEAMVRPAVLMNQTLSSPWKPIIMKTHMARVNVCDIPMIPPALTEGAVYIIRDPRDVALSFADHFDVPIEEAVDAICDENWVIMKDGLHHIISHWSNHVRSWTEDAPFKVGVVKYEDMVAADVIKLGGIAKYIGLQGDVEGAAKACKFSNLQYQESEHGFKERRNKEPFFKRGRAGAWREYLPYELALQIEEAHGETMEKHGYTASSQNYEAGRRVAAG